MSEIARFADAYNDDFPLVANGLHGELDSRVKRSVQLILDSFDSLQFRFENFPRSVNVTHLGSLPVGGGTFNVEPSSGLERDAVGMERGTPSRAEGGASL